MGKPRDRKYSSYCCQKCGEIIGWMGRFLFPFFHKCKVKAIPVFQNRCMAEEYSKRLLPIDQEIIAPQCSRCGRIPEITTIDDLGGDRNGQTLIMCPTHNCNVSIVDDSRVLAILSWTEYQNGDCLTLRKDTNVYY